MGSLDGRVAVVTGAGGGIGRVLALTMAREGASVVVNDLGVALDGTGGTSAVAQSVADEITAAGGKASHDATDVSDHRQAERLITSVVEAFGSLDVLINCAGNLRDRMVFDMSEDEWDDVIRVHLKGTFNTTRFASAWWRANRGGEYRLINFTSRSGLYGEPGHANYAAAKMGIVGFTLSCANELHRYGVCSNAVAPRASTRMTESIPIEKGGSLFRGNDAMLPERVAPLILYLASTRSSWLNGRVLGAGGGRVALYSSISVSREIYGLDQLELGEGFDRIEESLGAAIGGDNPYSSEG